MKRILKWIFRTILILLAVLLIALIAAVIFLDQVVKGAIETVGPVVAGVPVTVESVSVKPLRGRVEIRNFIVGNPAGYASEHAIKLGDVAVEVQPMSVMAEKIIIPEVRLRDVIINYETPITFMGSNMQDILDHVNKLAGKQEAEAQAAETTAEQPVETTAPSETKSSTPEQQPEKKPVRLQLNKMIVDNVQLRVVSKGTNIIVPVIVELPDMGPVGTSEEGVTPMGLTKELSGELYEGIYTSVLKSKDEILKSFTAVSTDAVKAAQETVNTAKEAGEDLKKSAEELKALGDDLKKSTKELKAIGKDLKNIFK